jgi:4,5-DOPA dioxygenase extradiol
MHEERQPVLFLGHGNPMNALQRNTWTEAWETLGVAVPRPSAVLAVSAHWYIPDFAVTAMERPATIHDFSGFPSELSAVSYPAPGAPALASRIRELLPSYQLRLDDRWGLDHGTWSLLCHVFPRADIPVVQLSLDSRQSAHWHHALGGLLAPLRDEGVLLLASGNVVHNLRAYDWEWDGVGVHDWAQRFDARVRAALVDGDDETLIVYESAGEDARRSVPTPEHYLPLLVALGARREGDVISFPVEGFDGGSISMLGVRLG